MDETHVAALLNITLGEIFGERAKFRHDRAKLVDSSMHHLAQMRCVAHHIVGRAIGGIDYSFVIEALRCLRFSTEEYVHINLLPVQLVLGRGCDKPKLILGPV